jgi:hypothetical protein
LTKSVDLSEKGTLSEYARENLKIKTAKKFMPDNQIPKKKKIEAKIKLYEDEIGPLPQISRQGKVTTRYESPPTSRKKMKSRQT